MLYAVRNVTLGEVCMDWSFRIFVSAYMFDAQLRSKEDWEKTKLPYVIAISDDCPLQTFFFAGGNLLGPL